MATYNLVEAGAAAGRTKSAILKAIKRGAISATRDTATGGWVIEPAELHRAFPPVSKETLGNHRDTAETGDLRELRVEVRELREAIRFRDETLADLRRRLDAEAEERRRLTALLTDQRSITVSAGYRDPPRSPWRRFLAWRR
jgi:hypothetical protein